jgi:PRTRC genetic system protein B
LTDLAEVQSERQPVWHLRRAVLVYFPELPGDHDFNRRPAGVYATVHDVAQGKRGPAIGAGEPATKEACADLARALGAASSLSGFVPPNLLYMGARTLAWWRPPGVATMHFNAEKDAAGDQREDKTHAKALGKRGGRAPQPGLVFIVTPGDWYVYAVPGTARPDADTKILRAPYFNVWSGGRICTGNVKLPETLSPAALAAYEQAFFGSEFTHPNVHGRERLVNHPGGSYAFWRELLDQPPAAFPARALVATKRTLGQLIEGIEKGKLKDE